MATAVATILTYPLQVVQARARVSYIILTYPLQVVQARARVSYIILTYPLQVVQARARVSYIILTYPLHVERPGQGAGSAIPSSPTPSMWTGQGQCKLFHLTSGGHHQFANRSNARYRSNTQPKVERSERSNFGHRHLQIG